MAEPSLSEQLRELAVRRLRASIEADRAERRAARAVEQVEPVPKAERAGRGLRRGLPRSRPKGSAIPPATLRALEVRSGGRCEVCPRIVVVDPSWVPCEGLADDPHHRRRQGEGPSKGGGHQLANLLASCRRAHTGWVHAPAKRDMARLAGLLVLPGDPGWDELGEGIG